MSSYGFSTSGSLAKQRLTMIEKCAEGRCRGIEKIVLEAVQFSPALKGLGKVQLGEMNGTFFTSFDIGNGETVSKLLHSTKSANDWLLSMMESHKKGSLSTTLKSAQKDVKGTVELQKATDGLIAGSASDETALSKVLDTKPDSGSNTVDVTSEFLVSAKPHKVDLPMSWVSIHKGSLNTYTVHAAKNTGIVGVMLGREAWNGKFHSVSIVLCSSGSFTSILENERVIARCTNLGLTPCGALVAGSTDAWRERLPEVFEIFSKTCSNPIVVCSEFSHSVAGKTFAWEHNHEQQATLQVCPSFTTNPRDVSMRFNYTMTFLDDFGISHVENATKKICGAILKHVMEKDTALYHRRDSIEMKPFTKHVVPADGLCGFYSILFGRDVAAYHQVPRKPSGFATNSNMVRSESNKVKLFHQEVCSMALKQCPDFAPSIQRVSSNPSFSPADLDWISQALGITVRVTCSAEAGVLQIHPHTCAYIYIV